MSAAYAKTNNDLVLVVRAEVNALRAQRDALLAAAKATLHSIDHFSRLSPAIDVTALFAKDGNIIALRQIVADCEKA